MDHYSDAVAFWEIPTIHLIWGPIYRVQFCRHVRRTYLVSRSADYCVSGHPYSLPYSLHHSLSTLFLPCRSPYSQQSGARDHGGCQNDGSNDRRDFYCSYYARIGELLGQRQHATGFCGGRHLLRAAIFHDHGGDFLYHVGRRQLR